MLLQPQVLSQKVFDEEVGKRMLVVQGANDAGLFQPHYDAFTHGRGRGNAQRLAVEAPLATQIARFKERDNGTVEISIAAKFTPAVQLPEFLMSRWFPEGPADYLRGIVKTANSN